MKLHNLKPAKGSVKKKKRIGRGVSGGQGRTSGRGHKGAKSRSGYKIKRNFEGGTTPLQMRLPKFGFNNPNRKTYCVFNLGRLQEIAEKYNITEIDVNFLVENGYAKKNEKIKVLGDGELNKSLKISVHAASESAKSSIESKGGEIAFI